MRVRSLLLLPAAFALGGVSIASGSSDAILHERIPVDARDDIALGVVVEGNIPAAIETKNGAVSAPDPSRPPTDREAQATRTATSSASQTFTPDRNTARPDVLPYDDPFTPSTAPFKRLVAYDAVDESFSLVVSNARLDPVAFDARVGAADERFYGDLVLDVTPASHVRIPTVGPGTRLVHARLGVGARDVPFRVVHDSADNWFIDASESVRARFVVDMAIPRAAFGGDFGDPTWEELPWAPAVPANVAHASAEVARQIGVSRADRPREVVRKLVAYFRAFQDSEEPPKPEHDIYTDLALAKKGVCRHRSYAFAITALSMGIPTRMVTNEAHAWVEVHDGTVWKRIDLGGAGRLLNTDLSRAAEPYVPPSDPFAWPPNATRGDDMSQASRGQPGQRTASPSSSGSGSGAPSSVPTHTAAPDSSASRSSAPKPDGRPETTLTLKLTSATALRGGPLRVEGTAEADGDACPSLPVDIVLVGAQGRPGARDARVGQLATDGRGAFAGTLVLPPSVSLGDYTVVARTSGDHRCGPSEDR